MDDPESPSAEEILADLRTRAENLERQLTAVQQETEARLIRAELKTEALRAGMIDLDGLRLIDQSDLKLSAAGDVEGVTALMARLKSEKPWLFGAASSSSRSSPPPAQPPRRKPAVDMTEAEYRAARAELLKRRF